MEEVAITQYIKVNTPHIATNCICNLLWDDVHFSKTVEKSVAHAANIYPGMSEAIRVAIYIYLRKLADSPEAFRHHLQEERKSYISPHFNTVAEYIKGMFETDLSFIALYNLFAQEVTSLLEKA